MRVFVWNTRTRIARAAAASVAVAACLAALAGPAAAARPALGYTEQWAQTPALLGQARGAGAGVVRVFASWSDIEAVRGRYSWGGLDAILRSAQALSMRPLLVAIDAPPWARAGGCPGGSPTGGCAYAPARAYDGDWTRFVRALVARYRSALGLEVWNEPNALHFFAPAIDPGRYTQLLREAYRAAKAVAPRLPVISGGLSGIGGSDANGMADVAFLREMYRAGARGVMDGIGYHLFPGNHPLLADLHAGLNRIRRTRNARHDRRKRVWLTELGISTAVVSGREPVNEAEQAAALRAAYCDVRAMGDVPVMLVYRLRDTGGGGWLDGLGVLRGDGSPKPAALALSKVAARPVCPRSRRLRISASTTAPNRGQVTRFMARGLRAVAYRWDLDGNGLYERYTYGVPTVSRSWRIAGRRTVRVEAYDNLESYRARITVNVLGGVARHRRGR